MTHSTEAILLPTWDLAVFFPSLDSPEFEASFARIVESIEQLIAHFDRHGIEDGPAIATDQSVITAFDGAIAKLNHLEDELETLVAFLYATISVDTRAEPPQTRMSELEQRMVALAQLNARFTAWIGRIDVETLIRTSELARDHEFLIRQSRIEAEHLMSPAEESLAAALRTSSGNAWSRLHENVSSQIASSVEIDGELRELSMPEIRLLALDPRRDVREAAYRVELEAWKANEVPIAAALNGIKGEALTLLERRRWTSSLDLALFRNGIDRDTLDAMLAAAREAFPDCRAYFNAKARLLGIERLAWYDLFAPLDIGESAPWSFDRARELIFATFHGFSPRLGAMAERAFNERWIDALPRSGKADGAYCISMGSGISRVFMNFTPSYAETSTLAHELGHAYHNVAIADRPALQRESPLTLAETASIFCETLLRHSAMADADARDELLILEGTLQDSTQTIVDIMSRFLFEQRLFERRKQHDVPASIMCELMTTGQQETYADGLVEVSLHPYMWAAKSHYYSVNEGFYNFPYLFGQLFSLGLYRQYQEDAAGFISRYDNLLSNTGRLAAQDLAGGMGIDLRSVDFWRSSLDIVRADIQRYIELANDVTPNAG